MDSNRDDFTLETKRLVATRVAYKCSMCKKLTSGPNTDPKKFINIGVAAHICAAAKGGPRYDENMTPEERKSSENAIWLCQNCAKLIDSDTSRYTEKVLKDLKTAAEKSATELQNASPDSHEQDRDLNIKISYNKSPNKNSLNLLRLNEWMKDEEYEFQEDDIKETIKKISCQNPNTKVVLAKIIELYVNDGKINMTHVLNEINCNECSTEDELAKQLKLLEEMEFIKDYKYVKGSLRSWLPDEEEIFIDVSKNYSFKLYNGNWEFEKRGEILLMIYQYINSFENFMDFLKGNISYFG